MFISQKDVLKERLMILRSKYQAKYDAENEPQRLQLYRGVTASCSEVIKAIDRYDGIDEVKGFIGRMRKEEDAWTHDVFNGFFHKSKMATYDTIIEIINDIYKEAPNE